MLTSNTGSSLNVKSIEESDFEYDVSDLYELF